MKTHLAPSSLAAVTAALLTGICAQAQIIGINAASSCSSIQFDDTNSINQFFVNGITNAPLTVSPWNGALSSYGPITDPNTFDVGQGDINATFAGNSYAINFANVSLTQPLGSTKGFALLIFSFAVEYQLGALGLPSQPTLFPVFTVTGIVQPGGLAQISGIITYDGVIAPAGPVVNLDSVSYGMSFNNPPPLFPTPTFTSVPVPGVPAGPGFGTTPALIPNTTLTLSGTMTFMVDPATITASSVMVPEPSSALLALLTAPLLLRRRRA